MCRWWDIEGEWGIIVVVDAWCGAWFDSKCPGHCQTKRGAGTVVVVVVSDACVGDHCWWFSSVGGRSHGVGLGRLKDMYQQCGVWGWWTYIFQR